MPISRPRRPMASPRSTPRTASARGRGRTSRASSSPRTSPTCTRRATISPSRPHWSEKGDVINGRGDTPNRHDVLTGSQADGTAFAPEADRTCKNWTSSTQGTAMVGHSDRHGAARRRRLEILEFVASLARTRRRLLAGRPQEHRRRWPAVLLRGELTPSHPLDLCSERLSDAVVIAAGTRGMRR